MSVRAGIIATGTELLSGQVTDRNGPWLSERLGELGVEVTQTVCVGDRPADMREVLDFFRAKQLDLVITSGGLGPTADDLTAEVVGGFAGREMVLDEALEEQISAILAEFAKRMNFDAGALREANRKQAVVPEGSHVLPPAGTAPGLVVPVGDQGEMVVVVLPGPPRELQALWELAVESEPVRAVLAKAGPVRTSTVRMFGLPESTLAKALTEIGAEHPIEELEITTCLRKAELVVDVRYTPGQEELEKTLRSELDSHLGRYIFSSDGTTIDDLVSEALGDRMLAVAESCTAGLLAARLTDPPGSSARFEGGVVSYSDEAKRDLLGVPQALLDEHGAVSPEVAEAMADGALERFGAEVAVAITGIAGPDGGSKEKPVGYVCFCAKLADGSKLAREPVLPGSRREVRERSTVVAMHLLRYLLLREEPPV